MMKGKFLEMYSTGPQILHFGGNPETNCALKTFLLRPNPKWRPKSFITASKAMVLE